MTAENKPRYPCGTLMEQPEGTKRLYVEADETIKEGAYVQIEPRFFVARNQPDIAGPFMPVAVAAEYMAKGSFGWVIIKGSEEATKAAIRQRATAKAEGVIDTKSQLQSQSRTVRVPVVK